MLQQFISQRAEESLLKLEPGRVTSTKEQEPSADFGAFFDSVTNQESGKGQKSDSANRAARYNNDSESKAPARAVADTSQEADRSARADAFETNASEHELYGHPDKVDEKTANEKTGEHDTAKQKVSEENCSRLSDCSAEQEFEQEHELDSNAETDWLDFVEGVRAFTSPVLSENATLEHSATSEDMSVQVEIEEVISSDLGEGPLANSDEQVDALSDDELSDIILTDSQVADITQALLQNLVGDVVVDDGTVGDGAGGDENPLQALSDEDKQLVALLAQLSGNTNEVTSADLNLSSAQTLQALQNLAALTEQTITELTADNINIDFIAQNRNLGLDELSQALDLPPEDTELLLDIVAEKLALLTNTQVTDNANELTSAEFGISNEIEDLASLAALLLSAENELKQAATETQESEQDLAVTPSHSLKEMTRRFLELVDKSTKSDKEFSSENNVTNLITEDRGLNLEELSQALGLPPEDTELLLDIVAEKLALLSNTQVSDNTNELTSAESGVSNEMSIEELTAIPPHSLQETTRRILGQSDNNRSREGELALDGADAESAGDTRAAEIMQQLAELPDSLRQKVNESIAEKIVASVPNTNSETQKALKASISSGLTEIQQQLAQGRVAGINLQDIVEQAVAQSNVNIDPVQLQASLDQQVQRVGSLLTGAQQAINILDGQTHTATNIDISSQENNQIKVEQGRALQGMADDKPVNINTNDGRQQLAEKIRWIVNSRNNIAEIRLDPPDLGSMQVRVNVSGDTASVSFVVQSAQARDALADATPRLREMLAQQGIDLGESFVQQESSQNDAQAGEGNARGSGLHNSSEQDSEENTTVIEQAVTRTMQGGIDAYA